MTPAETTLSQQVRAVMAQGRPAVALAGIEQFLRSQPRSGVALDLKSQALKQLGRRDDALAALRQAVEIDERSVFLRHNLAGLLGDMGKAAEAETQARRAMSLGGDAPETWLVLGRALMAQDRHGAATEAFGQAIRRRPQYADALHELAQLTWMLTGDAPAAEAVFDAAIAGGGSAEPRLRIFKARLQDYLDKPEAAYRTLTEGTMNSVSHLTAAQVSMKQSPEVAMRHVQAAAAGGGGGAWPVRLSMAECLIALGDPSGAVDVLEAMRAENPNDQYLIALLATAFRMLGDPRYGQLYDYGRFVREARIQVPDGWPTLDAYLADLAGALTELHQLRTHPIGQSVRGGSQTTAPLVQNQNPVIRAFFTTIDQTIRAFINSLGEGVDPLRSRTAPGYAFAGSWSVMLRPDGYHASHVHPQGWISSAFYVDVPAAVQGGDRQGWLKFGEPPPMLRTCLEAEHYVQPKPGSLALFPSYMWHGTQAFTGTDRRMTIAFDLTPQ